MFKNFSKKVIYEIFFIMCFNLFFLYGHSATATFTPTFTKTKTYTPTYTDTPTPGPTMYLYYVSFETPYLTPVLVPSSIVVPYGTPVSIGLSIKNIGPEPTPGVTEYVGLYLYSANTAPSFYHNLQSAILSGEGSAHYPATWDHNAYIESYINKNTNVFIYYPTPVAFLTPGLVGYGIEIEYPSDSNSQRYYFNVRVGTPVPSPTPTPTLMSTPCLILTWGGYGTEDGKFNAPRDICLDSNNYIYVVDTNNYRIQKFDSNGNFILKWGSYGSDPEKFLSPIGICSDENNYIYVADFSRHKIKKFDSNGNFILEWGDYGNNDGQFAYPIGCTYYGGYIYVIDNTSFRVQKFTTEGEFINKWNISTNFGSSISSDSIGNIYTISIYYSSILAKYTSDGALINQWSSGFLTPPWYIFPYYVEIDSYNNMWLISNGKTVMVDSNGQLLMTLNDGGQSLAIDKNNNIYLCDYLNHIVKKYGSCILTPTIVPTVEPIWYRTSLSTLIEKNFVMDSPTGITRIAITDRLPWFKNKNGYSAFVSRDKVIPNSYLSVIQEDEYVEIRVLDNVFQTPIDCSSNTFTIHLQIYKKP